MHKKSREAVAEALGELRALGADVAYYQADVAEAGARALRRLPNYHSFAGKAALPTIDLSEKLIGLSLFLIGTMAKDTLVGQNRPVGD